VRGGARRRHRHEPGCQYGASQPRSIMASARGEFALREQRSAFREVRFEREARRIRKQRCSLSIAARGSTATLSHHPSEGLSPECPDLVLLWNQPGLELPLRVRYSRGRLPSTRFPLDTCRGPAASSKRSWRAQREGGSLTPGGTRIGGHHNAKKIPEPSPRAMPLDCLSAGHG
jgi:hypothetical protein